MQAIEVIQQESLDVRYKEEILFSLIGPILFGLLVGLKREVVNDYGSINEILLRQLARNYKDGFGDCGICFEYAVHSAIRNNNDLVMERIQQALSLCGVRGNKTTSILLGFEKAGILQINNELINTLTNDSKLIISLNGESIRIVKHIENMSRSFRSRTSRQTLPTSISGIWKADLFLGNTDTDTWVAASVKINPLQLRYARGLCIGIVPARWNNETAQFIKNDMVVCPLLYDNGFMQFFYSAWRIVNAFIKNDAHVPNERFLSSIEELRVAKHLEALRDCAVIEIIDEDLRRLAIPSLIRIQTENIKAIGFDHFKQDLESSGTIIVPDSLFVPSF